MQVTSGCLVVEFSRIQHVTTLPALFLAALYHCSLPSALLVSDNDE